MTEEVRAILKEFAGNRAAMAGEIQRLRAALADARFEISRLASTRTPTATVLYPDAGPPIRPAPSPTRPPDQPAPPTFGFRVVSR